MDIIINLFYESLMFLWELCESVLNADGLHTILNIYCYFLIGIGILITLLQQKIGIMAKSIGIYVTKKISMKC